MPHSQLGRLHKAQNVHRHGIDIQFYVQVTIIVPCTSTDDDQINTTEFVQDFGEDRGSLILRHIDATHDGFWRKGLAQRFQSIKPAGQQP